MSTSFCCGDTWILWVNNMGNDGQVTGGYWTPSIKQTRRSQKSLHQELVPILPVVIEWLDHSEVAVKTGAKFAHHYRQTTLTSNPLFHGLFFSSIVDGHLPTAL